MKRSLILILIILLGACIQAQDVDLAPTPMATVSDPEWIREFDARLIEAQSEAQAGHTGSLDSQILLWRSLECIREARLAQARAAHAIAQRRGISREDAIAETQIDPGWALAAQRCER